MPPAMASPFLVALARAAEQPAMLTGSSSALRGREYYRSGMVKSTQLSAELMTAVVQGSVKTPYTVLVRRLGSQSLTSDCTCPLGGDCKHVAAALYAIAARFTTAERLEVHPESTAREAPAVVDGRVVLSTTMSLANLRAWGKAHALLELLSESLAALGIDSGASWGRRYGTTVQDVVCSPADPRGRSGPDPGLKLAVVQLLQRRASLGQQLAELASRRAQRPAPADPRLADAITRLTELRDAVRGGADVSPLVELSATVAAELDPPVLRIRFPEPVCNLGWYGHMLVDLGDAHRPASVGCDCRVQSQECHTRRVAVDLALDRLTFPEHAALQRSLGDVVTQPSWERLLAALDAAMPKAPPAPPDWSVGWRLKGGEAVTEIEIVAVTPRKRSVSLRRLNPADALAHPMLSEADRAAIMAHQYRDSSGGTGEAFARLAPLLVGMSTVFDGDNLPVTVRRAVPTLVARPTPDGGTSVVVRVAEHELSPKRAEDLLGLSLSTRPAVTAVVRPEPFGPLYACVTSRELARVVHVFAQRGAELPQDATTGLVARLARLSAAAPIALEGTLVPDRRLGDATPRVRLAARGEATLEVRLWVLPIAGLRLEAPGEGSPTLVTVLEGRTLAVQRDLVAEHAEARALAQSLALEPEAHGYLWTLDDPSAALDVLTALQSRTDLDVKWVDDRRMVVTSPSTQKLTVNVESSDKWFTLGGQLETELGPISLGVVLAALRAGQRYLPLGKDGWVRLTDVFRSSLGATALSAKDGKKGPELPTLAGGVLDALELAGARLQLTAKAAQWRKRIAEVRAREPQVPTELQATLRDYQAAGVKWLLRLAGFAPGACLADDMGLGKTVQALGLVLARSADGPTLVVAPTSVGFNWVRETERFAPTLAIAVFRGKAHVEALGSVGPHTLVVTSYDLLARYAEDLSVVKWTTLILDEAQAIKNPTTRRARAASSLDAGFTLALTGTPVENHAGELWSLMSVVTPGLLGGMAEFQSRFVNPIARRNDALAKTVLASLVRPFVLRRKKSEVARELPPRTEIQIDVQLTPEERKRYDELRGAALLALAGADNAATEQQRRFQILAALTRLRQLACEPRLVDRHIVGPSSKLRVLAELLVELKEEGHRALVFSQFTSLLDLVEPVLTAATVSFCRLDGSTPAAQRQTLVTQFQAGQTDVFLLSLKAGGTGLNLTAADYVIHLDPWWNPAVEDQATDRAHRIGQDKPVTVYRLVSQGTVEEGIVALHHKKRELVGALLEGTGEAAGLSTAELLDLVTAGASQEPPDTDAPAPEDE